jgi:hypothetical protein
MHAVAGEHADDDDRAGHVGQSLRDAWLLFQISRSHFADGGLRPDRPGMPLDRPAGEVAAAGTVSDQEKRAAIRRPPSCLRLARGP